MKNIVLDNPACFWVLLVPRCLNNAFRFHPRFNRFAQSTFTKLLSSLQNAPVFILRLDKVGSNRFA